MPGDDLSSSPSCPGRGHPREQESPLSSFRFRQPPTPQFFEWDAGQVGFDIENRRPIQHIDAPNIQLNALPAPQLDGGQANRVRTSR